MQYEMIWLGFYGISTTIGYLMPNSIYTHLSNTYYLVWLGFYGISTIVGYLMPNPLYIFIVYIGESL